MRDWIDRNGNNIRDVGIIGLFVMVIIGVVWLCYKEEMRWRQYKIDHHCVRSGQVRHSDHVQFITDGQGRITGSYTVTYTDYEWICDGDERFWR